ncbi:monocarboxylate transporter 9 [Episyrphus balteatus]|uniref:monocarboxylate transporter 9 n=1 Tax=Episyrphus balteatus TaxID=286459 RepID=UPI002485D153|nr:monocarboxylate transporter 9 [Episyrphus balteatus]
MKKNIKLEAPDGGWGYLVCIGMSMPFTCILGNFPSFGLIFGDFLKSIGAETSAIAFITSAFFCSLSFAGLFANNLFKRFSIRTVGIVGGVLYFMGSVMQIYVKSTVQLTVAYSLFQGIAAGLIIPSCYTIFNSYFVKKRVFVMSLTQTLIGIGTMLYPVIVQKLIDWYGFRGCLLVLAAINSHAILGMILLQPVEWHMKKVEVNDEEIEEDRTEPLMSAEERRQEPQDTLNVQPNESLATRMGSIVSLGNWNGPIALSGASVEFQPFPNKPTLWQAIVDFLDLSLLKDPIYLNIVLGMSFCLYSDMAFFTLQPLYLFELKYTKTETANIIAIGAAADMISRVVIAVSAIFVPVSSRFIYVAGAFFTFIARFAFLEVFDFTRMAIITAILGFLRTWFHVTMSLVVAEHLPMKRFASGYGLFMFLQGNIMFLIGPIVGYVRDRTQDYALTFHCLNFFMALCVFPWIMEMIYVKCRKQNKSADHDLN